MLSVVAKRSLGARDEYESTDAGRRRCGTQGEPDSKMLPPRVLFLLKSSFSIAFRFICLTEVGAFGGNGADCDGRKGLMRMVRCGGGGGGGASKAWKSESKVPAVRDSATDHQKKGTQQHYLEPSETGPRPMKPKKNSNVAVTGQRSRAWISLSRRDLSSLLDRHCVPGMLAIEAA